MTRAAWMTRVAGVALTALALTAVSAPAQQVRQQSVRPAYDVDSAMARATLLRRQNRKAEAERVMAQAVAMAPGPRGRACAARAAAQETRGGEAMAAAEVKTWREQLPEWREGMLSLRKNTGHGPVAAACRRVDRGPLSDDRLQVEAYPAFHTATSRSARRSQRTPRSTRAPAASARCTRR
jgi:hypothetical protein